MRGANPPAKMKIWGGLQRRVAVLAIDGNGDIGGLQPRVAVLAIDDNEGAPWCFTSKQPCVALGLFLHQCDRAFPCLLALLLSS